MMRVEEVKKYLKQENSEGWLLYDFQGINTLAREFLGIPLGAHITRRYFYWIPLVGDPIKIVPHIESSILDHLPGEKKVFLERETLRSLLAETLKGKKRVSMEYSPQCHLPYVSKVDGGTIDLIRAFGVEVVSSASFLQYFSCVWDEEMLTSHKVAATVLENAVEKAWKFIATSQGVTEYEVSQFVLQEIEAQGCEMEGAPICAVNANSANPHYAPIKETSLPISKGDFILLDLWGKQRNPRAVYADITRVAVFAATATEEQVKIFTLVKKAQTATKNFIQERLDKKEIVKGYEADQVCRKVIAEAGFANYFTHRTGHNIHKETHGPGAHLDSLETYDERPLISKTCFSIEPGIYLPGKFGVRLEYDAYITEEGQLVISGGDQQEITPLTSYED